MAALGKLAGQRDPKVGLCSNCKRASILTSAKGFSYWRCGRADSDAAFRRYPTLPVEDCAGFEFGSPQTRNLPADQERDPMLGSRDAASDSKGFAR